MADEIDYSVFRKPGTSGAVSERRDRFDGYVNPLTLIGDHLSDKVYGGLRGNLPFQPAFLSSAEIEARWSGSDLGARIIEAIPDEMTREWVDLLVQPAEDETSTPAPESLRQGINAQAQQLSSAGHADAAAALRTLLATLPAKRLDSEQGDVGTVIVEAMAKQFKTLDVRGAFNQALKYEQAYGGAAIFLGTDEDGVSMGRPLRLDGATERRMSGCDAAKLSGRNHLDATDPNNLTEPLDPRRVKSVTHLNVYTGGWDGELIAWRYYGDMTGPKYGMPEIYMLRNLGTPPSGPPAPGENPGAAIGSSPTIKYIHESRLLVFPGVAASRRVRQWNRGWGVSGFVRVEEVLSAYNQTWGGVALLMQELEIKALSVQGLFDMLTSKDATKKALAKNRAKEIVRSFSVARMYVIDATEKLERQSATLAGVADVLREFVLRLAAAANMPVSLLMGQVQGGLGDASKGDLTFFYDRVRAWQRERIINPLERLYRVLFAAGDSPTARKEPEKWSVVLRSLQQESPKEKADRQKVIADTDNVYVTMGAVSAPEVAATRFGGAEFNDGPLVIDVEGRKRAAAMAPSPGSSVPSARTAPPAQPGPQTPEAAASAPFVGSVSPAPDGRDEDEADGIDEPAVGPGAREDDLLDEDDPADPSTYRSDEVVHLPAGSPEGGQFAPGGGGAGAAGGGGGGAGGSGSASSSLKEASLGQLAVRLTRLAKAGTGSGHPEYNAIAKELKSRGIKSFGALERAIAAGK